MKRSILKAILLTAAVSLLFTAASCNRTSDSALDEDDLIPEKMLAGLPVYPGAAITTEEETGFKPFSTPLTPQSQVMPQYIVYETVSREYRSDDDPATILRWYRNKLTGKGYQAYSEMTYNGPEGKEVKSLGFYKPELRLISIEVHACDIAGKTVFAIIVNRGSITDTPVEPKVWN